tara:strand:- start:297 stop:644 length:348 start_codon:yes stop_codon:yes gene_type:complete
VGSTTGSASATASTAPSFSSTPFVNSSANLVDKSLLSINDFLLGMNLDNMNFFQVIRYVENSDIVRKVPFQRIHTIAYFVSLTMGYQKPKIRLFSGQLATLQRIVFQMNIKMLQN